MTLFESNPDLTQEERDALRRQREFKAIIAIGFVLGLLFLIESFFIDFRGDVGQSNILFFSLININVILACVLLFLILRNVTKLLFERRRKVLGARLRTRLVLAFVSFALIPTILLFYVAMTFITNSIERWFSLQIETSLDESLKLAQTYYKTFEDMAILHAYGITEALSGQEDFLNQKKEENEPSPTELPKLLEKRLQLLGVDVIELYRAVDQPPITVRSEVVPKKLKVKSDADFLKIGFDRKRHSKVSNLGKQELVRGLAPLIGPDDDVLAVAVVSYYVPQSLVRRMKQIQKTYDEYGQLLVFENPLRSNYLIILGLICVFILFSATWFGFYLARQITEPLQRLADGARRVAGGETQVQIEKVADDELGVLVDVFNRMWSELAASRSALESALNNLEESNVELERRRASMETVLSNVAAGVLAFDTGGRVTSINPSAVRILGLSSAETLQQNWTDLFPQEILGDFAALSAQIRHGKMNTVQQQVDITVGGKRRTVLAILSLILDAQGEPAGAVLVLDDLTELLKAQRMAAWQEVARQIAHEIKNPLTPIQLAAQRLRKRYGGRLDKEEDKVFFDSTGTIIRQVDELKSMVKEFSDYARIAEAKPSPTELADVIREVLILYGEAHKQIKFHTKIDGALPRLMFDREQIKRALINVMDNAVTSIKGTGQISVGAWLTNGGQTVRLEIADDGQGIPRAYRNRLFEPYFSTKKMGTGLGLAIVHRIIEDHHGTIHLEDNHPKGTIVVFEFQLSRLAVTPTH